MKYAITLFIILLCLSSSYAQKIDSLAFSRLSEELLQKKHPSFFLNKEDIKEGFFKENNCIYHKESPSYPYNCINNYWNKDWVTDLNNDGITDAIIKTTESIIPSETINFHLLILDDKLNISKTYKLYSGELQGQGGGYLGIDSLKNGHIYAQLWDNQLYEDMNKEEKPFHLEFFIEDNKLQEKNYSKCKLYTADKNMFRKTKNITASFSFDEYYNEKKTETLLTKQNNLYKASFSGCNNSILTFNYNNKQRERKVISKTAVKKEWLKHIAFLSKKTKFKHLFKELATKLRDKQLNEYDNYNAHINIVLENKQKVYLEFMFAKHIEGKLLKNDITIRVTPLEENKLSYWDILTNKFKY